LLDGWTQLSVGKVLPTYGYWTQDISLALARCVGNTFPTQRTAAS